jgi:hypothetical protein
MPATATFTDIIMAMLSKPSGRRHRYCNRFAHALRAVVRRNDTDVDVSTDVTYVCPLLMLPGTTQSAFKFDTSATISTDAATTVLPG